MRSIVAVALSLLLFTGLLGCGVEARRSAISTDKASQLEYSMDQAEIAGSEASTTSEGAAPGADGLIAEINSDPAGDQADGAGKADAAAEPIQRQIVYEAELDLVVEDFAGVPEQVEALAERHGGFVADSRLSGASGSPRYGQWTLRVPVRSYGTFLEALTALGEFQSLSTSSREVTAEYYDVQTRISNKRRQEARLLELLENQTGKLEDVLQVEEQIARVREETERMEGRMRVLRDLTSFSTIRLSIDEIKGYRPAAAPTFGNRIARAWNGTLRSMRVAAESLVIGLVAAGPWLLILMIPLLLLWRLVRRRSSRPDSSA